MKNKNMAYKLLFFSLLSILFISCKEDEITKINNDAAAGKISFRLNNPELSNYAYQLNYNNAALTMDSLTCVQPDYGFTAAVTYTPQVSLSSTFTDGSYVALSAKTGEKIGVNTKEINKALISLNGGSFSAPLPTKDVYIRLKAVINSSATMSALDDSLQVQPLYSNVIKVKIIPYMEPLAPYSDVTVRPWYIVGMGGKWDNSSAGLGSSLIPLSVIPGSYYDANGDGTFVYTGYIDAGTSFKLIRDVGAWSPQWGMTGSTYTYNSGDNISVSTSGYYKLTLNSIDNKLTIESTSTPSSTYTAIGLIGEFNSWAGDVALTANSNTGGHVWYATYTFSANYTSGGGCKFRANNGWDVNWGVAQFPAGIGTQGGSNIPYKAGTYTAIINDIDGCFYFVQNQ